MSASFVNCTNQKKTMFDNKYDSFASAHLKTYPAIPKSTEGQQERNQ